MCPYIFVPEKPHICLYMCLYSCRCKRRCVPKVIYSCGGRCGFPCWFNGKEPTYQGRRHRFHPWLGKIPWGKKWQPTPVFLPGKSHGWRSLAGYRPWGHRLQSMGSYANVHVSISFYLPSHVNGGVSVFSPHIHVNLCVLKCTFIYLYLCVFMSLHVFETRGSN